MNSSKSNSLIYKFNKLICILFCIWFAWPYANYKLGMYFGVGLSLLWFVTSGYFICMKRWTIDLFLVLVFFITLVPFVLSGEFKYSSFNTYSIIGTFYLFFLGMFFYHYYTFYKKDKIFLGKVALVTIVFYAIGAIQTYIGLSLYPIASRMLAVGSLNPDTKSLYSNIGIGGFYFVYSACFLAIMTLHPLIKQKNNLSLKYKLILSAAIISLFMMITKVSYAIALSITLFGCLLVLVVKNKASFYTILLLALLFLLIIPQSYLGVFFLNIADLFGENQIIYQKFYDLAQTLLGDYNNQSQILHRIDLYLSSLNIFFQQPIFGVNGPFGNKNSIIGGHSGWFDMMAYFGLFVTIPMFSSIWTNLKKVFKSHKKTDSFGYLLVVYLLFIVYGIINPVLYVYQIGLIVFFIVPSVPFISYIFYSSKYQIYDKA